MKKMNSQNLMGTAIQVWASFTCWASIQVNAVSWGFFPHNYYYFSLSFSSKFQLCIIILEKLGFIYNKII